MSYILHILTPYRYPILAALSLLLIAEMALAGVNLIPIEYEGALGWLMFLTIVAWTGIAMVIGVAAPAGGDAPKDVPNPNIYIPDFSVDEPVGGNEPKRRSHLIWILSPALFAMLVLLAILGANIFQAQFLLDLIRLPYIRVLVMVWIGMVVIVGVTANVDSSKKTYLIMNVSPILVLILVPVLAILALIGIGFIAMIVAFMPSSDHPGVGAGISFGLFVLLPVLLSLISSVFGTILIGTMRRPIRNITVAGVGLAAMILVFWWYYYLSLITM